MAARRTLSAAEAVGEDTALEVSPKLLFDVFGQALAMLSHLSEETLKVLLDDAVQHRSFWGALLVRRSRSFWHPQLGASTVPSLLEGVCRG